MKYRCIPCDHEFEHSGKKGKPRCPRCMGIHNIESASAAAKKGTEEKKKPVVPIVIVLLLAAAVGGYYLWDGESGEDETVSVSALEDRLVALGVPAEEIVIPFEVTEELEAFAEKASGGDDDAEGLEAMLQHLGKLRKDGKWTPHPQRDARAEGPLVAGELLKKIQDAKKGSPYEATSYEMATLLLAMSRAMDMDTSMAEIFSFEGEKKPADPGGTLGTFGVVFGKASEKKQPPLFDPYAGRSGESAIADMEILSDEEAIAPFFGHESLAQLSKYKTSAAHDKNDIAIKLAPGASMHRIARGQIFLAGGAPTESMAEFEKALKSRDDAVNRVNMSKILLLTDPTGSKAEAEIQTALNTMPDYAKARSMLAVIYAGRGDIDAAESELAVAERLDPNSPEVAMAWAGFYTAKRMGEEAIDKAELAVRLSGGSVPALLGLAGVLRANARFDKMREALDRALAITDSSTIRMQIKQMFGYNPDEPEEEEEETAAVKPDAGTDGMRLELENDSKSNFGAGLKLGGSLGGGDESAGPGLGGGSPGLGGSGPGLGGGGLKLDLNMGGQ